MKCFCYSVTRKLSNRKSYISPKKKIIIKEVKVCLENDFSYKVLHFFGQHCNKVFLRLWGTSHSYFIWLFRLLRKRTFGRYIMRFSAIRHIFVFLFLSFTLLWQPNKKLGHFNWNVLINIQIRYTFQPSLSVMKVFFFSVLW